MSLQSKVIWSEGMLLRPEHFQQNNRYLENLIKLRCNSSYSWGFTELYLDVELLKLGKFNLTASRGVFADGTCFVMPLNDNLPKPIDIPKQLKNALVYLCVPVNQPNMPEINYQDLQQADTSYRYQSAQLTVSDNTKPNSETNTIEIARLQPRLMLENEDRSGYICLAVAKIVETQIDNQVILDNTFIPPCLNCQVSPRLIGLIREIATLMHYRGNAIIERLGNAQRTNISELNDFLLLQLLNRIAPLLEHWLKGGNLHPEQLYTHMLQCYGELSTFTHKTRRPAVLPPYQHDNIQANFDTLMANLTSALNVVFAQTAQALEIQQRQQGIWVAAIKDRTLLASASFVLAVHADMASETLLKLFPSQIKIGPVETIRDLVNRALPGIGLRPLLTVPRELPFHAEFTYFELNQHHPIWKQLGTSSGFAFQVNDTFPGLKLELWAIRQG
ncbi:MAG: type secretion system-associated protein [Gammaproteobacteria bacterium]|jgi:type VI secretion system protein ImpJ|nr:type secretion system-associated protein [Gammaproteobacteria bacterium]